MLVGSSWSGVVWLLARKSGTVSYESDKMHTKRNWWMQLTWIYRSLGKNLYVAYNMLST